MPLILWIGSKLSKQHNPVIDWLEIVLSALPFAMGHSPVVCHSLEVPSTILLTYFLMGNTMGGLKVAIVSGIASSYGSRAVRQYLQQVCPCW
jgi:hypothetical protein